MIEKKLRNQARLIHKPLRALFWLVILSILIGCNTVSQEDQAKGLFDPFSATRDGGDGTKVEWSGFTSGYQPDVRVPVDIKIQNDTDMDWQGSFCLLVMDNAANALTALEKQEFTASHKAGFSKSISLQLPATIETNANHLVLVVERPGDTMVDAVTIFSGENQTPVDSTSQQVIDAAIELCQ